MAAPWSRIRTEWLKGGTTYAKLAKKYGLAEKTIRIDHHIFCQQIADVEVVDTSFESCCGMIAELAQESGWKHNPLSAKSLYTGMVTDSGRFRYDGTTARTFRLASTLMEQKFDTNALLTRQCQNNTALSRAIQLG